MATPQRKPLLSRVPAEFVRAVLKGHSSLGLAFAAAIYLVCLTGSIAVFAHEFQRWETADIAPMAQISPAAVQHGLESAIARVGGGVEHGFIQLPTDDQPQASIRVEKDGVFSSWIMDADGTLIASGDAPFTEFLTRLHINLHLPGSWGIFLVGLTGVALLSSLISGLLAHPRIFRDAFHLRLGGSRRLQEADLHNRIGIWALPFHMIVSLTGALLGLTTIIVGVLGMALFQGDVDKVYSLFIAQPPKDDPRPAPVIDLRPMFSQVKRLAPDGRTNLIMLEHPAERGGAALFNTLRDDSRLSNYDSYAFDRDGTLYHSARAAEGNLGQRILGSLGKLHFGWFGGGALKIAYALLGLGLTYLAAGGVTIWLARRRDKRDPAPGLERLWTATIWGQPAALGLAALATSAFAPVVTKDALIWTWGIATLIPLFAALRVEAADLSRWLKHASAATLIAAGAIHLARFMPNDPVIWAVDVGLLACGGVLLLFARGTAPKATAQTA
ncbi:MAG: PepSY-associated TM helix domain-containing protein [Sphingobium sp.]